MKQQQKIMKQQQEKEIRRLIDLGVDGIMTDEIVLLKSILKEKNLW